MDKNIRIIGQQNSLFNEFMAEIRSEKVQTDSMRFRRNLERMGEIFAYEISRTLNYQVTEVTTPLGIAPVSRLTDQVVLATILRAGLPLHRGLLNYFDHSENAFISAFRKDEKDGTFEIQIDYMSSPDISDKVLILADPMIATGHSMQLAYDELLAKGTPQHTHIVSIIAGRQGLEYLQRHLSPLKCTLWIGAVDEELTAHSFIVPGLGDAGDLAYGTKGSD